MNKKTTKPKSFAGFLASPDKLLLTTLLVKLINHSKAFCLRPGRNFKLRDHEITNAKIKTAITKMGISLARLKRKPKIIIVASLSVFLTSLSTIIRVENQLLLPNRYHTP